MSVQSEEVRPHIIIPHYIYASNLGCTGKMYCGLILGLTSRYGVCTAKDEYFARFFYAGEWDELPREEQEKRISAAKRQISRIIKAGYVSNVGNRGNRRLALNFIDDAGKAMAVKGQNVPEEPVKGQNVPLKGTKCPHLPIIYKKYIYMSNPGVETSPKSCDEMISELFDLFWTTYPRKEKKKGARKAFGKLNAEKLDRLLSVVGKIPARYASTEKRFIPMPTSFINGELWDDEFFTECIADHQGESEKNRAEKGGEIPESVFEAARRWKMICDGDAGEEALTDEDRAALERLGMSVEEAVEYIQAETLAAWRGRLASVMEAAA